MKKYLLSLLAVIIVLSCYEDKGNYNYKNIERVDIDFSVFSIRTVFGDTIRLDPKLSQDIDENSENYTFTWYLNDETREGWDKKKFEWIVDVVLSNGELRLEIVDKRNEIIYSKQLPVNIIGVYENDYSYMILSDNGGQSLLSFLSVIKTTNDSDQGNKIPEGSEQLHFTETKFTRDVMQGESLGFGPISLMEHFRDGIDWYEDIVGNVCVFQESGAVDLEGVGFTKEIDMVDAFDGGVYPNGTIYPGTFMSYLDIVTDRDGKLYSRIKKISSVYNSEYFLQAPVEFEDEVLEQCQLAYGYYKSNRYGYGMMHDGKNKRFLYIADDGANWNSDIAGVGRIFTISIGDEVDVSEAIPLDNTSGYNLKHFNMSASAGEQWWSYYYGYYTIFEEEATGKYFLQKMVTNKRTILEVVTYEIKNLPAPPSKWTFPLYNTQEYAFFSVGNKLYILDLLNTDLAPEVYYTFDSDITALNSESKSNRHLAVGLANGDFYVLGINKAKNIQEAHKLIYKSPEKVGKIVDVQLKNNSMWNY